MSKSTFAQATFADRKFLSPEAFDRASIALIKAHRIYSVTGPSLRRSLPARPINEAMFASEWRDPCIYRSHDSLESCLSLPAIRALSKMCATDMDSALAARLDARQRSDI